MRRGMPYVPAKQKENIEDDEYMSTEAGALGVGERCEVDPGGKRGVIRSICIHFASFKRMATVRRPGCTVSGSNS